MNLSLHKTKGLNPHMTYCKRCGGESNELMLLGIHDTVYECDRCQKNHIGYPKSGKCQNKSCPGFVSKTRILDESERLPATDICDICKKEIEEHKNIVSKGGIYWKCDTCHHSGVIKNSDYAKNVRKIMKIKKPEPCGVNFTGDINTQCPVCSKEK